MINLQTIIEALRDVLGNADFYITSGSYSGSWDYGAMIEYMVGATVLLIVVSSIFKIVIKIFGK